MKQMIIRQLESEIKKKTADIKKFFMARVKLTTLFRDLKYSVEEVPTEE